MTTPQQRLSEIEAQEKELAAEKTKLLAASKDTELELVRKFCKINKLLVLMAASICALSTANADTDTDTNGQNIIYVGGSGSSKNTNTTAENINPFSVGYLRVSNSSNIVWGFDVSGEGTMLDSTYGRNYLKQARSYNLLIGNNLIKTDNSRIDAVLIAGLRETALSCPGSSISYLGYQCYADKKPDTSTTFNFGAALTLAYKSFMLGARLTSESKQVLFGYRF